MRHLAASLGLTAYEQQATGDVLVERSAARPAQRGRGYAQEPASFRIDGGMIALIDGLAARLPQGVVRLGQKVISVERGADGIAVTVRSADASEAVVLGRHLVMTAPPRVAAASISFSPALPVRMEQAMRNTSTWMAGQAKFAASYERPFWRESGLSGAARSAVGPLVEIHDASTPDGPAALFGFVGLSADQRATIGPDWERAALAQLVRLFGDEAGRPTAVIAQDWAQSPLTATPDDWPPLTSHPRYGALPDAGPAWRDCLFWASTETAPEHGGYLEGALEAAEIAAGHCRDVR